VSSECEIHVPESLADNYGVRSLALVFASIFLGGSLLAALFMVLAAAFPYENTSSEGLRKDDWLALAAPVLLGLAVGTLAFVVKRKSTCAALAVAASAVIGLLALRFSLHELSDRSDTWLIVLALSMGFAGVCAVSASFAEQTDR
jgi:drug/metabolite transporter (DMT)-like permease